MRRIIVVVLLFVSLTDFDTLAQLLEKNLSTVSFEYDKVKGGVLITEGNSEYLK